MLTIFSIHIQFQYSVSIFRESEWMRIFNNIRYPYIIWILNIIDIILYIYIYYKDSEYYMDTL